MERESEVWVRHPVEAWVRVVIQEKVRCPAVPRDAAVCCCSGCVLVLWAIWMMIRWLCVLACVRVCLRQCACVHVPLLCVCGAGVLGCFVFVLV